MRETSIIIRTYNEERHLPRLLRALERQTYRDFEVIVGDSGSYDSTRRIAEEWGSRVVRLSSRDFTFGYSLNACIEDSGGRFVVIASAHTCPACDDWLELMVATLRNDNVAAVYGRQVGGPDSKFAEFMDFERQFGPAERVARRGSEFAHNANTALKRELWEEHRFDEGLPGLEDIEWAKFWGRRGYTVAYEPGATVYHYHDERWDQVRRRYYREAVAARRMELWRRRHLLNVAARETAFVIQDLVQAARLRRFRKESIGILRFRFEKTLGTITGTLDGASMRNPERRAQMLFDRASKAVVIHGSGRVSLEEVQLPPLKPGDVTIKVAYEGVCGTDLEILNGTLGYYKTGLASYPITPGHEFSGRVVEVGANVKNLREGDPVVVECIQSCGECPQCRLGNWTACETRRELGVIGLDGGYAEYVVVAGHFVHKLPPELSLRSASLCEPLAVVLKGLKRLWKSAGPNGIRRCLVAGAGPIGHLCAQLLVRRGCEAVAYDRSQARLSFFDGTSIGTITDLTNLSSYDALIDATGDPDVLDQLLHKSSAGATLLLLGLPYARREFSFEGIVSYDKTIVGSVGSSATEFDEAIGTLPGLDLRRLTAKTFSLGEFAAAWQAFRQQADLKVLLAVDESLEHDRDPIRR